MKKKIFLGIFTIMVCFLLVGCGSKANTDLEKVIEDENQEVKEDDNTEESTIKLYSTDNQLVYNVSNVYFIVIDFDSAGNASGFKWIYDYQDAATAASMVAIIKANMEEDSDIKSVTQDGKYIVVTYNESTYSDLTYENTKAVFSIYEQVEKQN